MTRRRDQLQGLAATALLLLLLAGLPAALIGIGLAPWDADLSQLRILLTSPDDGTLALVVIATLLAVVGNTMAMSVRERLSEYAVLKTLGFGTGRIALSILGESVLITLVGGVLGLALAFPVTGRFAAVGSRTLVPPPQSLRRP